MTVTPDPDGGGSLPYRATRTTYNNDGAVTMVEQGGVASYADCSAANSFCASTLSVLSRTTTDYDSMGRKARDNVIDIATGQAVAVTQYSYDTLGRVDCTTTRMNPAVFGSLPAACTLGSEGAFGPDRITKNIYNANSDVIQIKRAVGTGIEQTERTFTYTSSGKTKTVKDANNNLTTYEYDGFDRLSLTRYPKPSNGATSAAISCSAASQDYCDGLSYDAVDNITSERRRDEQTITNTWDNLNRLRLIDKPGSELDVTNAYDNYANLVDASQTGASVSWTYDALGRVTSEAQPNGTVAFGYNTAGQRTQLTYPGSGFYTNYQYYDDGGLKLIGLNGATSGSDVLATYYNDQIGRRVFVCRGLSSPSTNCNSNGYAATGYAYDAASRLTTLAHDLVTGGATWDASWTLTYSPSSQLVSRTPSSSQYEWISVSTFSDGYAVNGLNQYTTVAGGSVAHDHRGNTTNDTTKTYAYDSSNRLTSASNGASLTYDPTGRLLSIAQGGATTKFLYDGTRLIAEYDGSNTLLRRYVHGDGVDDPIVWFDYVLPGGPIKNNLFKDERGSIVAADTGSAVTYKRYDEYGNADGDYAGRFQYTGQTWLPEVSLNYYKARVFNPRHGRFMQIDPIGYEDSMNLYAYVGNDPLNNVDPTGRSIWTKLGKLAANGGDVASTLKGVADDIATIASPAASGWDKVVAVANLLSEVAPVSTRDVGDAANALGKAADALAGSAKKAPHGNKIDGRPATLYEKYDKKGNFQKHGVTKHENPEKRYTSKEIDGGTVVATDRGPRNEMLKKERDLVERSPGPDNREPWAGKRKGQ